MDLVPSNLNCPTGEHIIGVSHSWNDDSSKSALCYECSGLAEDRFFCVRLVVQKTTSRAE